MKLLFLSNFIYFSFRKKKKNWWFYFETFKTYLQIKFLFYQLVCRSGDCVIVKVTEEEANQWKAH